MCDCEELLTRLTAAAVAKYNDKVPEAVVELALKAQICDYPVAAIEKNSVMLAVPSFLGIDCYKAKLEDYFQSNSLNESNPYQGIPRHYPCHKAQDQACHSYRI